MLLCQAAWLVDGPRSVHVLVAEEPTEHLVGEPSAQEADGFRPVGADCYANVRLGATEADASRSVMA